MKGAEAVWWASAVLLGYTFAGYSWLMRALAGRARRTETRQAITPTVTVVLVVRDEARRLVARLEDLLAAAYPPEALDVVVVSDGSQDGSGALVRSWGPRVTLVELPEPRGKAAGVNAGVAAATGELVVFADARQRFAPETIAQLVAPFAEAKVGAVSGSLQIESARSSLGQGMDLYWRGERRLRAAEARWDSCIGCTGAVYAARRELVAPLPEDTILDDVLLPMRIALQGYRVLFEPEAVAYDPQALEPDLERRRKRRTLAGNFQMLFRYPAWVLPWRNRLWWQLLSHKYLRLAGPVLLGLLLASNALLAENGWFYRTTLTGQAGFYALALLGPWLPGRLLALPGSFLLLNVAVMRAFWAYACRAPAELWGKG